MEMDAPHMKKDTLIGTGQLPKFEETYLKLMMISGSCLPQK